MSDETLIEVVLLSGIAVWAAWYGMRAYRVWRHLRGQRIVTCPETGRPASVRIDVGHAIATLVDDPSAVRLQTCSRWPERGPCDELCAGEAQQYESAASRIVYAWAQDKACVFCGSPLVESDAVGHHVALLGANGVTREWLDIAAERLRQALATELPVCWNCHIAETFRRSHAELVTDRDFRKPA
jgi:hypothetical protein